MLQFPGRDTTQFGQGAPLLNSAVSRARDCSTRPHTSNRLDIREYSLECWHPLSGARTAPRRSPAFQAHSDDDFRGRNGVLGSSEDVSRGRNSLLAGQRRICGLRISSLAGPETFRPPEIQFWGGLNACRGAPKASLALWSAARGVPVTDRAAR